MSKRQGLFVFIDTRASTKRIYSNIEFFEDFISSTLNFVLNKFSNNLAFPSCQAKPLGDGLLIYYISNSTLSDDSRFQPLLRNIVTASISCVSEYHDEMVKKSNNKERTEGKRFQLGISIGSGYLYDFHYEDENKNLKISDIGSIDLTYVFRLNKFANPEGIVVEHYLYEAFKAVFDELGVFTPKRKLIDDAFGERLIFSSKEVSISDEETDLLRAYRELGKFSINVCNDMIMREIDNATFTFDVPPAIRFMLFKCDGKFIEEVYNLYVNLEGGSKSIFPIKPVEEIRKSGKYPFLIYECYYERDIVYFAYKSRYIKDVDKYIAESKDRYSLEISDAEARDLFNTFYMRPSSAIAIPILDKQDKEVRWILALDSEETRVFKKSFFGFLGVSIRAFFNTHIRDVLEATDNPKR